VRVTNELSNGGATASSRLRPQATIPIGHYWAIVPIFIAFVALGAIYERATPIFEAYGEPWHYIYVRRLADGRGLPPLEISHDPWEQGQAHQPPLYYAVGALLTRGLDAAPADALYERNPYARLGSRAGGAAASAEALGNRNAVLHLDGQVGGVARPERARLGVASAIHRLRRFSILCSALTVLLTYWLALEVVPRRPSIAASAAALAAFNPQFAFISAAATSDALAILLVTLALYLATRAVNGRGRPHLTMAALGLSVGLASLTMVVGLASVLLIPCVGLAWARVRPEAGGESEMQEDGASTGPGQEPHRQPLIGPLLLALGLAVAISGWWYVRGAAQYGDVLGLRAMLEARSAGQESSWPKTVLLLLWEASESYWGLFGWDNIPASDTFYALVRIVSVFGAMGMLLALAWIFWRRGNLTGLGLRGALPVLSWVLLNAAWLIGWTALTGQAQGQLLFPAISGLSLLLSIGLTGWLPRRYFGLLGFGISTILLVLSLTIPSRYIAPAYERPKRIALEQVPAGIQDLNVSFGDSLFLLGYELGQDSVEVGEALRLRLYWLGRVVMDQDYALHLRVLGREGHLIGALDTYPGLGSYPTRLWLPGDVLCDDYVIPIAPDAEGPTAGTIWVGVSAGPGTEMLTALDAQGEDVGPSPPIAQVRVAPAREVLYQPGNDLRVNLGRKAMLLGYDLFPSTPTAGDSWQITLYWEPLVRMSKDYTVFVHLIDAAGDLVAQMDEQPLEGEYPTHLWQLEEQIKDGHRLPLPDDLPAGWYRLEVGLYLLDAGERLAVVGADPPATSVLLGPFQIMAR